MLIQLLVQTTVFLACQPALLMVPAGTWRWPQAWAFIAMMATGSYRLSLWLLRFNRALLAERMAPAQSEGSANNRPQGDGGDHASVVRLERPDGIGCKARLVTHLALAGSLGQCRGRGVLCANHFRVQGKQFRGPVVKIQSERAQHVIDTGPYAIVHHPMYSGAMLFLLGMPLALGSWWGLALAPVMIGAMVVRTLEEEQTLRTALAGYSEYMARGRWRFVPQLW